MSSVLKKADKLNISFSLSIYWTMGLTHWRLVTSYRIIELINIDVLWLAPYQASPTYTIIGSGNGLSPVRCQAISGTSAELLSFGPGRSFSGIVIKVQNFSFNTLMLRQNGLHFADEIFICIFLNENCCVMIKISLKFIPNGPIDNNPALVQIMGWHWTGDTSLSEMMMSYVLTHICVTRPLWVKKMHFETSPAKCWPFVSGLDVLILWPLGDAAKNLKV